MLTLEYITTHVCVGDIAIKILRSFNVCLLSWNLSLIPKWKKEIATFLQCLENSKMYPCITQIIVLIWGIRVILSFEWFLHILIWELQQQIKGIS